MSRFVVTVLVGRDEDIPLSLASVPVTTSALGQPAREVLLEVVDVYAQKDVEELLQSASLILATARDFHHFDKLGRVDTTESLRYGLVLQERDRELFLTGACRLLDLGTPFVVAVGGVRLFDRKRRVDWNGDGNASLIATATAVFSEGNDTLDDPLFLPSTTPVTFAGRMDLSRFRDLIVDCLKLEASSERRQITVAFASSASATPVCQAQWVSRATRSVAMLLVDRYHPQGTTIRSRRSAPILRRNEPLQPIKITVVREGECDSALERAAAMARFVQLANEARRDGDERFADRLLAALAEIPM